MPPPNPDFLDRLQAAFENGSFVKLTLGHPLNDTGSPRKLLFRPVRIRNQKMCSIVSRYGTRDETVNVTFSRALAMVKEGLGRSFQSANLFTETEEVQLELDRGSRLRVTQSSRGPAPLEHDRQKSRWVEPSAPFLTALGVTDSTGKVRERMGDKFRQIERFVDLLASAYRESDLPAAAPGHKLTVCDMGAGKGYLTFATHDFFHRVEGVASMITGVEARGELVALCNRVAGQCGCNGLRFIQSTIDEFAFPSMDILVALHACDTATDDALAAGIRAGASVILAAPCCHKQLRPQVDASAAGGPLHDILRHGIFAERHAEILTDALRALLLERAGYRVRVSEFVSAEHTAKNVMLIATRLATAQRPDADLDRRIAELKHFYGIQHHRLEELLVGGRQLGCATPSPETVPPVH